MPCYNLAWCIRRAWSGFVSAWTFICTRGTRVDCVKLSLALDMVRRVRSKLLLSVEGAATFRTDDHLVYCIVALHLLYGLQTNNTA